MPNIYDNIELPLLPALQKALKTATHADFCVGYFNLRGWKELSELVQPWGGGAGAQARVLVGMQRLPSEEVRQLNPFFKRNEDIDVETARKFKQTLAVEFRRQLEQGRSDARDRSELLCLAEQLETGKVAVKLHCRHPLHAKLYLLHLSNEVSPQIGFLGSSNLTYSGLGGNVDIKDDDACLKLARWFDARWDDRFSLIFLKSLPSFCAGRGSCRGRLTTFISRWPITFRRKHVRGKRFSCCHILSILFEYQGAAVKMAARNINKRGGVMIGDVVGLGKTVMACAVAKIFTSAPYHLEVLVLCPASLVKMWENARTKFGVPLEVKPYLTPRRCRFPALLFCSRRATCRRSTSR